MDLNDDILVEILLHLPVKSVFKFRSVCKSWCKIIDSSSFRKSHFTKKNSRFTDECDTLFLQFRKSTWTLSPLLSPENWKSYNVFPEAFQNFLNENFRYRHRWPKDDGNFIIDGPTNGLICMYNCKPIKYTDLKWTIAICNPCLGEIKILPISPVCSYLFKKWSGMDCNNLDRRLNSRNVGFGFDSDYKVVQWILFKDGGVSVEVYSGRTNTWREVVITGIFDDIRTGYPTITPVKSTCDRSGKTAYWKVVKVSKRGIEIVSVVLSFDMQNEVFESLRLPEFEGLDDPIVFAKDDHSFVLFGYNYHNEYDHRLEMWELENAGWTHVRDVNYVGKFEGTDPCPIALWKDGLVLRTCVMGRGCKDLILYDFCTKKERKCELPKDKLEILQYKCTLYSLFGDIPLN